MIYDTVEEVLAFINKELDKIKDNYLFLNNEDYSELYTLDFTIYRDGTVKIYQKDF